MAKAVKIEAEAREKVGKGASRAARRANKVPAVIYGDNKEPVSVQIPLNVIVRLLNRGGFMSHTYEIAVGKDKHSVLPRDLQLHPVTDVPMHIDFLRLGKGTTVVMNVPVRIIGEEACEGLIRGGVINHTRHDVELNVAAENIPEYVEADISALDINDAVRISDIKLPEGAAPTITDRDFIICTIVAPSGLKSSEGADDDEEEVEGEEGEASEEASSSEE